MFEELIGKSDVLRNIETHEIHYNIFQKTFNMTGNL